MCVCTRVCVCVYPPPPPTTGYTHPHPHTRVHTHTHTYPPPGVGARTASIRDAPWSLKTGASRAPPTALAPRLPYTPPPAPTLLRSKRNGGRCNAAVAQPRDLRPEKSSPENRRFSRAPPTALAPRLPYTPPPAPTHLRSKRNGRCNAAVVGARTARKIVYELTNSTINVLFVPARTASQTSEGGFRHTQRRTHADHRPV